MKRKLIDLANQRTGALQAAEAALQANNTADYDSAMETVRNLNTEIQRVQNLLDEQQRALIAQTPTAAEQRDMDEERAEALRNHGEVKFSAIETLRGLRNAAGDGTLVSGAIVQPTGAGTEIHDNLGQTTLLDLVRVEDMTGLSGWDEPYAVADQTPAVGKVETVAGTARTKSDPAFGIAQVKPYEVSVTSLVDRNIARLSPAAYMAKIQTMAMRALRNKIAQLILLGDAEAQHVMYGMINGTNKDGGSIITTLAATVSGGKGKVDEQLLNDLYFAYGNNYEVGGNAMLMCNKSDLKALGAIRGTNEKHRLFSVTPNAGQANRGVITDGGLIVPYLLDPAITAIDGTTAAATAKSCCIYGDPMNYLLGLFGDYTIRVDESVKAIERMYAILGDAVVGGNVVVDKGFVVSTIKTA